MADSSIKSYKDLIVWQKAFKLVKLVYKKSSKLPKEEIFALQSQIRRSAVSIVSNIAEGSNRKTRKDYAHFLHIAFGSISELETQLLLCKELYAINIDEELDLLLEVSKMLRAIIKKLEPNN
mgnify:CR=1 FL=1